jgi:hypothetical protein
MARRDFLCAFMLALLYAVAAAPLSQRSLVIHPNEFSDFAVPRRHSALGVEFLNHELYGGISTQMVFGESFEEASLASKVGFSEAWRLPLLRCADRVRPPARPPASRAREVHAAALRYRLHRLHGATFCCAAMASQP